MLPRFFFTIASLSISLILVCMKSKLLFYSFFSSSSSSSLTSFITSIIIRLRHIFLHFFFLYFFFFLLSLFLHLSYSFPCFSSLYPACVSNTIISSLSLFPSSLPSALIPAISIRVTTHSYTHFGCIPLSIYLTHFLLIFDPSIFSLFARLMRITFHAKILCVYVNIGERGEKNFSLVCIARTRVAKNMWMNKSLKFDVKRERERKRVKEREKMMKKKKMDKMHNKNK